jgi:hypothetical protein
MQLSRFLAVAFLAAGLCSATTQHADASILVSIDKAAQKMTVSVDGEQRWIWPVSTGRSGHTTPSGSFRPFRMEEDHYSKEWDDAPMPHSIFFTGEGHAIHGSLDTRHLGSRASHGCVRLAPNNAAKLFALVKEQGMSNTKVVIKGGEDAPVVARRMQRQPEADETMGYATRSVPDDFYAYPQPERAYGSRQFYRPYYPTYGN